MAIALFMVAIAFIVFSTEKGNIVYGIAFGLVPLAFIQLLTGSLSAVHAVVKQKTLLQKISINQNKSLEEEHQRMLGKVKRFPMIRKAQEVIFVFSIVGVGLGVVKIIDLIQLGFSMALLLQVAVMIVYDLFAARRAEEYLRRIKRTIGA